MLFRSQSTWLLADYTTKWTVPWLPTIHSQCQHASVGTKSELIQVRVKWHLAKISARVANQKDRHEVTLETNGREHSLNISAEAGGLGSSVNGGELLFLALATCYCNDLYREASKRGIDIERLQVEVSGEFEAEGETRAQHDIPSVG